MEAPEFEHEMDEILIVSATTTAVSFSIVYAAGYWGISSMWVAVFAIWVIHHKYVSNKRQQKRTEMKMAIVKILFPYFSHNGISLDNISLAPISGARF